MSKFKDIPFYRLDMVSYKRHFEEELERFSNAKTMEEAYDAMLDLDTLMVKYQTMATIVEIRNTMDVTDAFYKEEAAWCIRSVQNMKHWKAALAVLWKRLLLKNSFLILQAKKHSKKQD